MNTESPASWPAVLFGLCFVVGPGYWIGNQSIIQRALGAKSEYEAKAAYVYGALLKNIIPFFIAIPGLIALAKFPELGQDRADTALGQLVGTVLPAGLRGMFVAVFLAALMSTVDSLLNSATTLYVNDFYRRFYRPNADDGQLLTVGRWTTAGFVAWAVYFAFQIIEHPTGIYTIFQTMASFILGPTLAVLLAGMLARHASSDGAVSGFYAGIFTALGLFAMNQPIVTMRLGIRPLFQASQPYLYYSLWSFLVSVFFIAVFSYFLRSDPPEKIRYALGGSKSEGGTL